MDKINDNSLFRPRILYGKTKSWNKTLRPFIHFITIRRIDHIHEDNGRAAGVELKDLKSQRVAQEQTRLIRRINCFSFTYNPRASRLLLLVGSK